jgi:hypothetical protein
VIGFAVFIVGLGTPPPSAERDLLLLPDGGSGFELMLPFVFSTLSLMLSPRGSCAGLSYFSCCAFWSCAACRYWYVVLLVFMSARPAAEAPEYVAELPWAP